MSPCIMPGPSEPTTEQMSHCLEPSTKEMAQLKNGTVLITISTRSDLYYV